MLVVVDFGSKYKNIDNETLMITPLRFTNIAGKAVMSVSGVYGTNKKQEKHYSKILSVGCSGTNCAQCGWYRGLQQGLIYRGGHCVPAEAHDEKATGG